jgi:hypothetical protein
VFHLQEHFWYALDPEHQDELEVTAKSQGICFLIERPTNTGLQVVNRAASETRP